MTQETLDKDPWDEEDIGDDPWDIPDEKPTRKLTQTRVAGEEAQARATEEGAIEWAVRWKEHASGKAASQREIAARKKREQFLNHLSMHGSPTKGAKHVGLTRRALYLARQDHPDFARNWDMAMDIYHMFEAEEHLRKRVIDGILEPIYYQGSVCGYKRVYDSGLTQFWYKANMRDKYGDKTDVSINANINYGVAVLPARAKDPLSWEQRAARTLEEQQKNMIDITAQVVDVTPAKTKNVPVKVER